MLATCEGCNEPIFDDEKHTEITGNPRKLFTSVVWIR
jgi:hypothetical protein